MLDILRLVAAPSRVIRRFAGVVAGVALILSLSLNIAVLSSAGVHAAASAALSAVGISTLAAREASERRARQTATLEIGRKTADSVTKRMQRGAARNIASVGGEAIPVVGIAVIAGALALEVKDACDTAADMAGLEAALAAERDIEAIREEAINSFDCATILPSYDDVPGKDDILAMVQASPKAAWDASAVFYADIGEADWSGKYSGAKDGISEWLEPMLSSDGWRAWWTADQEADQQ